LKVDNCCHKSLISNYKDTKHRHCYHYENIVNIINNNKDTLTSNNDSHKKYYHIMLDNKNKKHYTIKYNGNNNHEKNNQKPTINGFYTLEYKKLENNKTVLEKEQSTITEENVFVFYGNKHSLIDHNRYEYDNNVKGLKIQNKTRKYRE